MQMKSILYLGVLSLSLGFASMAKAQVRNVNINELKEAVVEQNGIPVFVKDQIIEVKGNFLADPQENPYEVVFHVEIYRILQNQIVTLPNGQVQIINDKVLVKTVEVRATKEPLAPRAKNLTVGFKVFTNPPTGGWIEGSRYTVEGSVSNGESETRDFYIATQSEFNALLTWIFGFIP